MMKIKKIILGLCTAAFVVAGTSQVQAQDMKIGVVDTQKILTQSSLFSVLKNAEKELMGAEKQLYETRNRKLKELENAQKTMTPEQFLKLRQKFEQQIIAEVRKQEGKLKQRKAQIEKMKKDLEKSVQSSVKAIARQKGLTMVINKQLVLFGGVDITNDVVQSLRK